MKKKMLVIFCCFCFLLLKLSGNIVQAEKGEDEPTNLYARSAVLMDADSGRILFGKDERLSLIHIFVGKGMLDAAVCGDIFASPSQIQIYQAIKETAGNAGTLMIIKNYSGDMMNFKNAARLAEEDGISVEYVKVDDDIAVQDSLYTCLLYTSR